MEKENQRIIITKRMLKNGLLVLLKQKSLDKISVTELCRESGINRATFYRHYEIPKDVLIELEKDLFHELTDLHRNSPPKKGIRLSLEAVCDFLDRHADLLRIIIENNSDTDFILLLNDLYQESWAEIADRKLLQDVDPEDIKILTTYCAGGSYSILRQWLLGNIKKSPKEIATIAYEFLCKTSWDEVNAQLGLV